MRTIDWVVMCGTILAIIVYGIWKSRGAKGMGDFVRSNDLKWWTIGLSIMATQASAITFLSTPGQGFDDGMRFVQFYFGVPIAMVIISIFVIPIYHKLNVYTAYEYLEGRFDLKTRTFTALLFLASRGLAAGMTIYAPGIILSTILGWDINLTCIGIGIVVIIYTMAGGTKAVSQTQQQQMAIILIGMLVAGVIMVFKLPPDISFGDAINIAGKMGKLNIITSPPSMEEFDIKDRYNIWSGLIGGTFLALSYFGTDQSQVQRYLGGKSLTESRIGLLFNGIFKVPMQFLILFLGAMMFVFYQFNQAPIFFNEVETQAVRQSEYGEDYKGIEGEYYRLGEEKVIKYRQLLSSSSQGQTDVVQTELLQLDQKQKGLRKDAIELIKKNNPGADTNDLDQVFLTFVITHLPAGIVGLLIAVILSASMSSTSAELNALATTSLVDGYKRFSGEKPDGHYLGVARYLTLGWGIFAIFFALYASELGNLIQAVNIIGSLFYGTILGIFVVAFFFKKVGGTAVFIAALIAEAIVITLFRLPSFDIGFLWFNLIGCVAVVVFALMVQRFLKKG